MTQREVIIEQAMKMFVSQGVKAVRMDDIAQSLSVSKRTLYELFGDKEELLYQSIKFYIDKCNNHRKHQVKELNNGLELIMISLRDMVSEAPVSGRLRRNLRRFYPQVYQRLDSESHGEIKEGLRRLLAQCVEDGFMMPTSNCDFVVNILYDSVQGAIVFDGRNEAHDSMEHISLLSYAIVIFIRGLCTKKGVEIIDKCFVKYFGNIPAPDTLSKA